MADNQYKIELGVKLDTSDLKSEINKIDGKHKVKLGVDLGVKDIQDRIRAYNNNSNNIKVKLKATLDTDDLKKQINKLNLSTNVGDGVSIPVNTRSLEESLERVERIISDVRNSLGTLDDKSGVQSLVASVNQIATALGKAEDESDSLIKSLNTLSKKEFGVNLGLDLGKKGNNNMVAYGRQARKQVIPQLEAQIKELEGLFGGQQATMRKLTQHGKNVGFDIFTDFEDFNSDSAIKKMEAMEKYIGSLKKLASIDNISLDGFNSKFSKTATDLIDDIAGVDTAVDKASDIPEKLKNIFGSSVNADNLNIQLDDIVANLKDIKVALQGLSSGNPLGGLTASFDRLSGSIENLLTNAEKVKGVLGGSVSNVDVGSTTDIKIKAENIVPDSSELTSSAQQVGKKIGDSIEQSVEQSINLDDVIDKQVLDLMDKFSIAGGKGSKAFNEIKQALEECRLELNILKNSDIGIDEEVFDTSRAVDKVTDAIANQMRAVNNLGDEYIKLADYITDFNRKNSKIHIPDFIKQEQGDDYKSNKGGLGIAFTTGKGQDFADFITELNGNLGETIDLTKGEAEAFDELVRKVKLGREQRDANKKSQKYIYESLSTEEILEQNGISKEEIYADTMSIVSVVDSAEDKIAQASTQSTNVVTQNEERRQQAYRETSGVIQNLKTTLETMRVDRSSIDTIIKDIEELGFTATDTSVKMKNGKFDITVNGIDDIGKAITEIRRFDGTSKEKISLVSRKVSQPLAETDKFVKQQKKAVADLTNQINQLNRSAIDQNASRPIKDSAHLDVLEGKYNEITSAIQRMGDASSNTFDEEANSVKTLIFEFKSLTKEFINAENVSSKMKGTDFDSGLDIAKNDLEKFKAQAKDFPQITATIKELDKAIEGVGDVSSLNKFNDQLRVARSELAKVKSETTAINRSEKVGINVSGLESKIADIRRISPEIDKFETEIDGAKVSVQSLLNDLKKVNTQGDFSVINSKFKAFSDAAKAAGITLTETVSKVKTVNQIKFKLADTGFNGFEKELERVYAEVKRLGQSTPDLEDALRRLDSAMEAINVADKTNDMRALVSANEKYEVALKQVSSQLKLLQKEEEKAYKAEMLEQKKASLSSEMEIWLKENTKATRDFGEEIRRLQASLDGLDDRGVNLVGKQFKNITKQAQAMGKTGLTVFDKLKSKAKEYMTYLSAAELFMYAEQAFRSMFEQVKLIDSAMTELKKVTDETDASYDKFLTNAATRAKEIGTTIDGLVASTADFARLGFGFKDAQGLAEVANIYAVVGDDIDSVETATQSLISTLTAFKNEMGDMDNSEFALSIVDKMNEVANNYAISSGGIGDALQRSASSMMSANNSLDETIALITAANTVVDLCHPV